jgi:hypothetical protein
VVYERGIAWRDSKGLRAWRWEEVQAISSAITRHYSIGILTGTSHVYKVFNRQTQRVVFTDALINVARLGDEIEQNIYPILYDRASSLYNAGQRLQFGPVMISKAGITVGRKLSLERCPEIAIRKGISKYRRRMVAGSTGKCSLRSPNLRVLLVFSSRWRGKVDKNPPKAGIDPFPLVLNYNHGSKAEVAMPRFF